MPAGSLAIRALALDTGTRLLCSSLDLTVGSGTRLGVVGPNGSGKSTLLRVLSGDRPPTAGTVERRPASTSVLLLEQEAPIGSRSVRDVLLDRAGVTAAAAELEHASAALADGLGAGRACAERYDRALARFLACGADDADGRVPEALVDAGLAASVAERPVGSLSRGEATRVQLAVVGLARVEVLLLDEPTNDLDAGGLARLDALVARHDGALVVASHDRGFLERTVTEVLELGPDGHAHHRGGWASYREERARARRLAREAWERHRDERAALVEQARRRREWARQGVGRARRSSDPDKLIRHGRIQGAQRQGAAASRLQRAVDRQEPVEKPWEGWDLRFDVAVGDTGGRCVADLHQVCVARGGRVVGPVDLEVDRGERVRLAGPNGAGKTTVVDVLLGRLEPTAGSVHLAPSLVVGELAQRRHSPLSHPTLLAWGLAVTGLGQQEVRAALAPFGLRGELLALDPARLSTGERTRAELALLRARGVGLLVLDEPTNHLDLDAVEALEEALDGYPGALILVSHDERFVERVGVDREVVLAPS